MAPASSTAEPTASASPSSATPSSEPEATSLAATFAEETGTTAAVDVVAWDGGFLAIGQAWPGAYLAEEPLPRLWVSADGSSWEARPMDLGVERARLAGVVVRSDGRLLVGSSAPAATDDASEITPAAWTSADGSTWEAIDLPMETPAVDIDGGARGYALTTAGGELWFSTDAESWTRTADGADGVRAGDEGFVALQVGADGPTGATIASADGETWFTSAVFAGRPTHVAPLGGDWLVSGFTAGGQGGIGVWRSPDGLDWTQVLDVNDLTPADGPKTGRGLEYDSISGAPLAAAGTRAFITLTNNHCCAQLPWSFGVWATSDGETWTPIIEEDAVVEAAAIGEDGNVVMVGYLRRGEEAAFWRLGDGE